MPESDVTVDLTPSEAARALLLNDACARFEAAWKATGPPDPAPRIEDFLASEESQERTDLLLRLVSLEIDHRRRRGAVPTAAEYEARFPDLAGRVPTSTDAGEEAEEPPAALNAESAGPESVEASGEVDGVETTVQPPPLQPQLRSERYVVGGFHARGGVGEIWTAEDSEIGRTVALKRLRRDREAQKDRFLVEAQVTGQLEHPSIVPVHDLGIDEAGTPFYVMKFIHGRTLKDVLAEHHDDVAPGGESREVQRARLLEIFVKICQTIAYAHHRGVLHRDLKPENIMLGPFGEVLVLDWGMAKLHGQPGPETAEGSRPVHLTGSGGSTETEAGTVLGSPPYMPPEAAEGRTADVDERTDVYLLGATLYHLLTGKPPREGSSVHEIIELARTVPPPPPRRLGADVPRALEAICLKAMAHRKESRYTSVHDLVDDMERYLAGAPVSAYPEPMLVRMGRWCKRHRRALIRSLSAALLLSLFASGTVMLIQAWNAAERIKRAADLLKRREPARTALAEFHRLAEERQFLASVTTPAGQSAVDYDAQHGREAGEKAVAIADRLERELQELAMPEERKALHRELHDLLLLTAAQTPYRPESDRKDVAKVLESLKRAISLPGHGPSRAYYRLKARCHRVLGDEEAAALEEQRAEAEPPGPLDHFLQAEEYRARAGEAAQTAGDELAWQPNRDLLLKAVAEYREALRLQPDHFWCHLQMGRCYLSLKRGAEAVAALDACVALRPREPWGYSARGLARGLLRDYTHAEADLDQALAMDPEFRPALLHRGILAWLDHKDERALADFARVLEPPAERRLVEAAYYRGQLHIQRNEIAQALADLDMVVKESPAFRPVYLTRAQAHFRDGGKARGLGDLTTFMNGGRSKPFGPNDPVLFAQRGGLILRLAPNWGLSADEHGAALRLARDDLERAFRMGYRAADLFDDLASVAHRLGEGATALAAYERGLAAKPSTELAVKILTKRGWIYAQIGDGPHRERARADFAAAVRLEKSHADAHAGLGFVAALRRLPSEAKGEAGLALWHGAGEYLLLHNVACIYAELSRVEADQAQQDQNIAMDLLGRAVTLWRQAGKSDPYIDWIRQEPSLRALHDRQDFRDLIAGTNQNAGTGR
jgi:serine/threonine protein kinase/tetratricopeptide (TPR) repeat protein